MNPSRETIMQAFFDLLKTAPGFTSYSRRMALAQNVAEGYQPALILYETNEKNSSAVRGAPAANTLYVKIIILARVDYSTEWEPDQAGGAAILNPLMDAVESVLGVEPFGNDITLGGLVYRVVPDDEDQTIKDVGDTEPEGQAVAVMPYKIIVP